MPDSRIVPIQSRSCIAYEHIAIVDSVKDGMVTLEVDKQWSRTDSIDLFPDKPKIGDKYRILVYITPAD
jgi:hypothetical protein